MIGVKNSDMDLSPIHVAGKIIGVQSGTMHERYVDKYFASKSVIKRYQTQDEANEDLFNRILWREIKGSARKYPGSTRMSALELKR